MDSFILSYMLLVSGLKYALKITRSFTINVVSGDRVFSEEDAPADAGGGA